MNPKIYPRTGDTQTVYLNAVVQDPSIEVGEYTIYNDFVSDPRLFEQNNVLYYYPINHERLVIGRFCSIACGAKFLFNCANHSLKSLSSYTFPLFYEEWGLEKADVATAWDNRGDIIIGNDVWIGFEAVIMAGVHIGDGAIIGARGGRNEGCSALYDCGRCPCPRDTQTLRCRYCRAFAGVEVVGLVQGAYSSESALSAKRRTRQTAVK